MEKFTNWTEVVFSSFQAFGENFMSALPNVLGAIIIILLGWLVAKIIAVIFRKVLKVLKFDNLLTKLDKEKTVDESISKISPTKVTARFVFWILMLFFFVSATDTLGWTAVSQEINNLINFLPSVFIAIIIFIIGYYIAYIVKRALLATFETMKIDYANTLSNIVFYLIIIFIVITSLNQIGVDTTLFTSNITIILGAVVLTLAIAFGFSSKDFLVNIISSYYNKNNFSEGDKIKIGDTKGKILKIEKISIIIKTDKGKVVIPSKMLTTEKVEVEN
ncbi:MAG: mechanosensitive ion channel [Bacteroidales bacterium]|nr:mechanosensitive ion channel [Bacteroidales bacterium]